jgi:hypothetical protein
MEEAKQSKISRNGNAKIAPLVSLSPAFVGPESFVET